MILVVCNWFSKIVHFISTTEKMSAEELARLFKDHIWKLHGLPKSIILNRGVQFIVGIIRELNKLLEIQTKLLVVYYSQTDGQMERINQELEQYLKIFIDYRQKQWLEQLETAEFAYNNKIYLVTKISPFKSNYGQNPRVGFEKRKFEIAKKFVKKIKKIQKEVRAILRKVQKKIKRYVDKKQGKAKEYKIGDLIL